MEPCLLESFKHISCVFIWKTEFMVSEPQKILGLIES